MSEIPSPPPAPSFVPNGQPQQNSSMAIASLVCGILGLIGVLPLIGSILAIVFGRIFQRDFPNSNDQYARIGIILGWIGIGLLILVIVSVVILFLAATNVLTIFNN